MHSSGTGTFSPSTGTSFPSLLFHPYSIHGLEEFAAPASRWMSGSMTFVLEVRESLLRCKASCPPIFCKKCTPGFVSTGNISFGLWLCQHRKYFVWTSIFKSADELFCCGCDYLHVTRQIPPTADGVFGERWMQSSLYALRCKTSSHTKSIHEMQVVRFLLQLADKTSL